MYIFLPRWCSGKAYTSVWDVVGSIPCRVLQNTLTMVVMAALIGAQCCGVAALQLTGYCRDKWTSSTGKLPMYRRDITEQL